MKIVFTTDQIYLHGGIERVLAIKANYFADVMGYDVSILITEQQGKKPFFQLSQSINVIDISIDYNRDKSYFSFGNLRKVPGHFFKMRNVLHKLNPDVIITCNFAFDFYWLPFINKTSRKIKEYHGSQYMRNYPVSLLRNKLGVFFRNQIEKRYDALVVLNVDEKTYFKSDNTFVIPNPIQLTNKKASLQDKRVVAAGRIAPVKGFERLVEIWALVVKEYPDWSLDIYGDDYLGTQEKLQKQIDYLDLKEKVVFKGTVNDMPATMCHYSVYAMTSQTECLPMVLLEALSVGLPIIAFDVPTGPRNIITDNVDGYLIEDGQVQEFVRKLKDLIKFVEERKKMGLEGKENVERFSMDNIGPRWASLFEWVKTTESE